MFLRYFRTAWLLTMLGLFLVGCDSSGGDVQVSDPDLGLVPPPQGSVVLQQDSAILNQVSVSEIDGQKLVLVNDASLDSLLAGMTIARTVEPFFLRKIVSVSRDGNRVVVSTTQATLEDLIAEGEVELSRELTQDDLLEFDTPFRNVSLQATTPQKELFTLEISQEIDGTKISGSSTFSVGIDSFKASYSLLSGLEQLNFISVQTVESRLSMSSTGKVKAEKSVQIGKLRFRPIAVGPVVVFPEVPINLVFKAEAAGGLSVEASSKIEYRTGLKYKDGSPTEVVSEFNVQPGPDPRVVPNFSATASAYVEPKVNLLVYGVAGPSVKVALGPALHIDPLAQPIWDISLDAIGEASLKFEIFSNETIAELKFPLFTFSTLFWAPPAATDDFYSTTMDKPLTVSEKDGVLANDSTGGLASPAELSSETSTSEGGTVEVMPGGRFTYEAPSGFTGTDSFTYKLENTFGVAEATVTIRVGDPQIVFQTQPHDASQGAALPEFQIKLEDPAGMTEEVDVELLVESGPGTLSGTTVVRTVNGIASFSNVLLNQPGLYMLRAQANVNGDTRKGTSQAFSILPPITGLWAGTATNTLPAACAGLTLPGSFQITDNAGQLHGTWSNLLGDGEFVGTFDAETRDITLTSTTAPLFTFSGRLSPTLDQDNGVFVDGFDCIHPDGANHGPSSGTYQAKLVKSAPEVVADSYFALMNASLLIPPVYGLLANDDLKGGKVLGAPTGIATSAGGVVAVDDKGGFVYTPPAFFTGSDSFEYSAVNAFGASPQSAAVTFTVTALTVTVEDQSPGQVVLDGDQLFATVRVTDAAGNPVPNVSVNPGGSPAFGIPVYNTSYTNGARGGATTGADGRATLVYTIQASPDTFQNGPVDLCLAALVTGVRYTSTETKYATVLGGASLTHHVLSDSRILPVDFLPTPCALGWP